MKEIVQAATARIQRQERAAAHPAAKYGADVLKAEKNGPAQRQLAADIANCLTPEECKQAMTMYDKYTLGVMAANKLSGPARRSALDRCSAPLVKWIGDMLGLKPADRKGEQGRNGDKRVSYLSTFFTSICIYIDRNPALLKKKPSKK